jgi:hypothetical protein
MEALRFDEVNWACQFPTENRSACPLRIRALRVIRGFNGIFPVETPPTVPEKLAAAARLRILGGSWLPLMNSPCATRCAA